MFHNDETQNSVQQQTTTKIHLLYHYYYHHHYQPMLIEERKGKILRGKDKWCVLEANDLMIHTHKYLQIQGKHHYLFLSQPLVCFSQEDARKNQSPFLLISRICENNNSYTVFSNSIWGDGFRAFQLKVRLRDQQQQCHPRACQTCRISTHPRPIGSGTAF